MSHVRSFAALALALVGAAALPSRSASAQAMSETGFHAGQNALEADVSSGSSAIGWLHFTSPTSAIALRVGGQLNHASVSLNNGFVSDQQATQNGGQLIVGLGLRHYRPIAHAVSVLHEFGVTGNISHAPGDDSHYFGGGVYGDIGGQYAFSPNLSVGVTTGLAAVYMRQTLSDVGHANLSTIGTNGTRATVTFYF